MQKTLVLKEDETYVVFDEIGGTDTRASGVYRRDTRYLSQYAWHVDGMQVLQCQTVAKTLRQCGVVKKDVLAVVMLDRTVEIAHDGLQDQWSIKNTSTVAQTVHMKLEVCGDGRDMFAVLSDKAALVSTAVMHSEFDGQTLSFRRTALDGVALCVSVFPVRPGLVWDVQLAPGEVHQFTVGVTLTATDDAPAHAPLPDYAVWRAAWKHQLPQHRDQQVLEQAVDDLRMLLMTTEHGIYPAAGMPHFVTVFGRDALITAMMLLPQWPDVARGVLKFLAAHQGRTVDAFREEEPGKILHEMRRGELSRAGHIPFGRYYGSVDSTPLFLMALGALCKHTGDATLLNTLKGNWELAAQWLASHQEDDSDLIAFKPSGSGLLVQSWKDSNESMVHADGSLAVAPLAVAEVQGYAYAAFLAVADFYSELGDTENALAYRGRAQRLAGEFDKKFWLDDLGTYAMAIDGLGKPLRVLSSDPGHLLWCGIVPQSRARRLVGTLMSTASWSGWGLRTLASSEVSFRPVSYHNGSIWPHDTALFGAGLARYGFKKELDVVVAAMFDLAASQPGQRLPELISGQQREPGLGPVNYMHACRPQAWAAAALPFLAHLQATAKLQ